MEPLQEKGSPLSRSPWPRRAKNRCKVISDQTDVSLSVKPLAGSSSGDAFLLAANLPVAVKTQ